MRTSVEDEATREQYNDTRYIKFEMKINLPYRQGQGLKKILMNVLYNKKLKMQWNSGVLCISKPSVKWGGTRPLDPLAPSTVTTNKSFEGKHLQHHCTCASRCASKYVWGVGSIALKCFFLNYVGNVEHIANAFRQKAKLLLVVSPISPPMSWNCWGCVNAIAVFLTVVTFEKDVFGSCLVWKCFVYFSLYYCYVSNKHSTETNVLFQMCSKKVMKTLSGFILKTRHNSFGFVFINVKSVLSMETNPFTAKNQTLRS